MVESPIERINSLRKFISECEEINDARVNSYNIPLPGKLLSTEVNPEDPSPVTIQDET
jgi:hypothetical protein